MDQQTDRLMDHRRDLQTDQLMDLRTNGQTDPLIEMWGCILKAGSLPLDRISSMERELRSFNHRIVSTGLVGFFCLSVRWMVSQSVGVKYPSKRSIDRLLGHLIITEESDANKYSRFHLLVHRRRNPYFKRFWSYELNFLYDSYLVPIWLLDGVTYLPANFWGPTPWRIHFTSF